MVKHIKLLAVAILSSIYSFAADGVMFCSFHTAVYDLAQEEVQISFTLYASKATPVTIVSGGLEHTSTVPAGPDGKTFYGEVAEDGNLFLYTTGNVDDLYGIDLEGAYVNRLNLAAWQNIEQLNLEHNELSTFDFSDLHNLTYLNISDNPFNGADVIIGDNHPNLQILEMAMIDNFNPAGPGVSNFPKLSVYNAYSTRGYTSLDFSGCPRIMQISIPASDVRDLVIGSADQLSILNLGDTHIDLNGFDFSRFPSLTQLYVDNMGLHSIDVSANKNLIYLFLSDNNLSSIDISKNTKLRSLFIARNQLSDLDISSCPDLNELIIRRNNFTFASLPEPSEQLTRYEYTYQNPMHVDPEYRAGDPINLADRVLRDGSVTNCFAFAYDEQNPYNPIALSEGTDFTYADGVATFLHPINRPVYLTFSNSMFPGTGEEAEISTTQFFVRSDADFGKPIPVMTFMPSDGTFNGSFHVTKTTAAAQGDIRLFIDWTDGNGYQELVSSDGSFSVSHPANYRNATVALLPGFQIDALDFNGSNLITIDVTGLPSLSRLCLSGTGLYSIDLSMNRMLQSLDLSGNNLSYLTLDGQGVLGKLLLTDINVANNNLSTFIWSNPEPLLNLNLSGNNLSHLNIRGAELLRSLDISDNDFEEIDIAKNTALQSINVAGNHLAAIELPNDSWTSLDISRNNFTFASMPRGFADRPGFVYAPQAPIVIPSMGPSVNLSSQFFTEQVAAGTYSTEYSWFNADGSPLDPDSYNVKGGVTTFNVDPENPLGEVFCVVSNGAYPDFSGEDALKTTLIQPTEAPTNVIASFTTPQRASGVIHVGSYAPGAALYVDWGDGDIVVYDACSTTPVPAQPVTTIAGGNVKFYAYNAQTPVTVLSVYNIPMADINISNLSDVVELSLGNDKISEIDLTGLDNVSWLNLSSNALTSIDLSPIPHLNALNVSNNSLSEIILDGMQRLDVLSANSNRIAEIDLSGAPSISSLDLGNNLIEEIDLSPLSSLYQLNLAGNRLSSIDLENLAALHVVSIAGNRFDLSTLPLPRAQWGVYYYSNQQTLNPVVEEGNIIDLTSQAFVGNIPSQFFWFDRQWNLDDQGQFTVEPLKQTVDYDFEDGLTAFIHSYPKVYGLIYNDVFPQLLLNVYAENIVGGLESPVADNALTISHIGNTLAISAEPGTPVTVFNIVGQTVFQAVTPDSGTLFTPALTPAIYLISTPTTSTKTIIP